VESGVHNRCEEHMFDRFTWGFRFHTVCGQLGFKRELKVPT